MWDLMEESECFMKLTAYVFGGLLVVGLVFCLIAWRHEPVNNPIAVLALVMLFGAIPAGAFWMMFMAIRHEKTPGIMILIAFLPFSFLWYYVERVRSGVYKSRLRE